MCQYENRKVYILHFGLYWNTRSDFLPSSALMGAVSIFILIFFGLKYQRFIKKTVKPFFISDHLFLLCRSWNKSQTKYKRYVKFVLHLCHVCYDMTNWMYKTNNNKINNWSSLTWKIVKCLHKSKLNFLAYADIKDVTLSLTDGYDLPKWIFCTDCNVHHLVGAYQHATT